MKTLTFIYITARNDNLLPWFLSSLARQTRFSLDIGVIVVDFMAKTATTALDHGVRYIRTPPKPTVWQGPHRKTTLDWWAASNARNTGICLCETEWIAFVDDRSIIGPAYLDCIAHAMNGDYVVCGTYEKCHNITGNPFTGKMQPRDCRLEYAEANWIQKGLTPPFKCPGDYTYGSSIAMPLEWALEVNGFDETCDSVSGEDCVFGLMLENRRRPIFFDPRMKLIEDRTPSALAPEPTMRRTDKGVSPNDKSHALLAMLRVRQQAQHFGCNWNIREIRQSVLAGNPFPMPTGPTNDWYDGQPIGEMV